jgi:hypothetical protein
MVSSTELAVGGLAVAAAGLYIFREQIFPAGGAAPAKAAASAAASALSDGGDPRDFVAKLKAAVRLARYLRGGSAR